MSGFIYEMAMKISGESQVLRAANVVGQLDGRVDQVGKSAVMSGSRLGDMGSRGSRAMSSLKSDVNSLIARIGLIAGVGASLRNAADFESLERSITFASAGEGAQNLQFINDTVDSLGLPLRASLEGFKNLAGGVRGTGITMQQTRDLFYSVSEASTVLGMSADDTKGVLNALSQVASKGKVSAEELRGQMGERLAGAFYESAAAMGVSTAELDKMLSQGSLMASEFLPKLAGQLHDTFSSGVKDAVGSANANFNKFQNSVTRLSVAFGSQLLPIVTSFATNYLIPAIGWMGQNIGMLTNMGLVIGGAVIAQKAWNITMALSSSLLIAKTAVLGTYTALTSGTITITSALAAAQWGLNAAWAANPIGIVIAGLAAVGGAITYAWRNFAGFRGFLTGTWEFLKNYGSHIWNVLVTPLKGFALVVEGILKGDLSIIREGLESHGQKLEEGGAKLAGSFGRGYQKGLDNFAANAQIEVKPKFGVPDLGGSSKTDAQGFPTAGGGAGTASSKKTDSRIKSGIEGITGGGKQTKNININVKNLVETLKIEAATVTEGTDQMVEIVMRKLLQVVNSANQVQ